MPSSFKNSSGQERTLFDPQKLRRPFTESRNGLWSAQSWVDHWEKKKRKPKRVENVKSGNLKKKKIVKNKRNK